MTVETRFVIEIVDGWGVTTGEDLKMGRVYQMEHIDGWPRKGSKPTIQLVGKSYNDLFEQFKLWNQGGRLTEVAP